MSFDKEFYAAKAKGGPAFSDVIQKARALGYEVVDGALSATGKVKPEPKKPVAVKRAAPKPAADDGAGE